MHEVALLLGLMCKYACEDSRLYMYNRNGTWQMDIKQGTILDNMHSLRDIVSV